MKFRTLNRKLKLNVSCRKQDQLAGRTIKKMRVKNE